MRIIDTHCDTLYRRALRPQETPCVTAEALRAGGVTLQVCALYAGSYGPNAKGWQNPEAIAAAELESSAAPVALVLSPNGSVVTLP